MNAKDSFHATADMCFAREMTAAMNKPHDRMLVEVKFANAKKQAAYWLTDLYEADSQSFKDIPLDKQIELGINDWVAEDADGHQFFGRTADDAANNCVRYNLNN
jgi:hypothetical protein